MWWFEVRLACCVPTLFRARFEAERCECPRCQVLVMVQKLLLSSVLVFLYTGTASQVAIAFFITFAFLLLVLINRPFTNQQLQTLQVCVLIPFPALFCGSLSADRDMPRGRVFISERHLGRQVYALVTQALNMFFGIMLITAGFQVNCIACPTSWASLRGAVGLIQRSVGSRRPRGRVPTILSSRTSSSSSTSPSSSSR